MSHRGPKLHLTESDLLGRWHAVALDGTPCEPTEQDLGSASDAGWTGGLQFDRQPHHAQVGGEPPPLRWQGYDGCNWWSGYVLLKPDGAFATSENVTTLRGCLGWDRSTFTMVTAVTRAIRITITDGTLTFYGANEGALGSFEPAAAEVGGTL